ncbi:hypothetical protein Trydic_g5628 [Trypoxylus dichotomus]
MLALYVEDGLILDEDRDVMQRVVGMLQGKFKITIDEPGNFVGIEIVQKEDGSIFVQQSYIRKIIRRIGLENSKTNNTPAGTSTVMSKEVGDKLNENIPYREAVGFLMFAAIASRPDIAYAVGVVSRYLDCYTTTHWSAVKRILKYLNGTSGCRIRI